LDSEAGEGWAGPSLRATGETGSPLSRQVAALISAATLSIRRLRGLPVSPHVLRSAAASIAVSSSLAAIAGCGGAEGVASGASVTAYVVQPLCAEASQELVRGQGRAGDLRVKAVCLPTTERRGKLMLATVGANARRATEDSTAVAFLEVPGRADPFAHPILETAEIPWIASSSGKTAMAKLLRAIERAGTSGSLRASLSEELR
jgi:hypothetical protein